MDKPGKKAYIELNLDELFKVWLEKTSLWGAIIFLLLSGLDYLNTPDKLGLFLSYRAAISVVLLAVSLLTRRFRAKGILFHRILAYIAVISCSVTMELMILSYGGHESPYYVGMILLGLHATLRRGN